MLRAVAVGLALVVVVPARAQLEPQPRADDAPIAAPPPRLENPPELLAPAEPVYPAEAQDAGRSAEVVLRLVIDEMGTVERVDVVQSAAADASDVVGRAFDWAAMGASTNFIFAAATACVSEPTRNADGTVAFTERCGQPTKVAIDYKQSFQLQQKVVEVPVEEPSDGGPLNLEGVVREAATKDPLEGVEVVVEVEKPGVAKDAPFEQRYDLRTFTTGEDGRFSFRGIPLGGQRITFTLSGYEPAFVDEYFEEKKRNEVVVYLTPSSTNKFETVVRRKKADKDVAKISLTRDEVKKVPGTFGDPIRVIENLPGLARAPFIGGALIVRGANPADTGVYFDGVEIPLLYHFGGLTSVVNAEFLEDIAFYPGGFGAEYGRATAGIVDVTSRKLKLKGFRGYAEADLIDAGFFFAGPVQVGNLPKVTFAAAARRSYIDGILPVALDAIIGENGQGIVASPVYWDYQTKLETTPIQDNTFSLFLFGSDDDLKVFQRGAGGGNAFDVGFHQTFHRLVGRWEWRVAPGVTHTLQPYAGLTRIELDASNSGDEGGPQTSAAFDIDTWNWGARDTLAFQVSDNLTLRGGVDYLAQTFAVNFDVPLGIEIGAFPRVFQNVEGTNQQFGASGFNHQAALWFEAQLEPVKGVRIVPGVRGEYSTFTFLGDKLPDGTTSQTSAVELFHIDPRLTVRWTLIPKTTLKAAAGIYRQPPDPQTANPDTGNPNLNEPRAVQLIAGVEQGLTRNINLDFQAYFTNRDQLIQSTNDVENDNDGDGEANPLFYNNGGTGRTIGVEVLLRHEITEYLYGWIAYTLSRSIVDVDDTRDRDLLTNFDQTHILTVVAQTNLPWGFTLGGRFRLVTGSPTNKPLGSVHDLDTTNYNGLGSTPQSSRLPTFHQLDLRVDRKWVFDTFSATAYLDLLNVYNQQNAEGFILDYRSREQQAIPSLPILPVIGMSAEF